MIKKIQNQLVERFLNYVKINTQSDDSSTSVPSTKNQFDLAGMLQKEFLAMGLKNIELTGQCYLTATLPSNSNKKITPVGFIAHMDTSPEMKGKDVSPKLIKNYDGKDIILNAVSNISLSLTDFPFLKKYKGQTLITTDGTTLLGADNKAGIAEIVTAVEFLLDHPEIKHGDVHIAFTPDEEIGRGADHFDVKKFGAKYAYTVDSGEIGSLEYETFNAAGAVVKINGKNVHPGYAKGIMINALHIAIEFNSLLPSNERPEYTEGYEGFFHLMKMEGNVEKATLQYIVRDHDNLKFEGKKRQLQRISEFINSKYLPGTIVLELKDQYYNMKEKIEPVFHVVEIAKNAYTQAGIQPKIAPIRGGTDGARLSYMGLPTPNIFTGGHNFHSRFEFIPVESMVKSVEVIINIIKLVEKS